ncbi:MAG TPA: winged helix-turn-helix domain-containing protein [Nocardioides sp.]|uniref:ArsR/SmtB family transcription factor n=1 Tax=Nocardioides sp. TaxID=35761 RepID=UPI002E358000|nr:winged helix-turn-helix domain-containing protein [Nocardioides sp.]HEX3932358.1 winged helix-turn-helix domain-containing protein [Nocardioides sp.]
MAYDPPSMADPRVLRAIAHPTRGRILDELDATGPMRAADVGEALGIPANQASFHLRQLAKYGVIVPAPESARDRRDRVYKLPDERGFRIDGETILSQPGGKAAMTVFKRTKAAWAHRLVDEVWSFKKRKDSFSAIVDQAMRLSKDEAAEFMGEIDAVMKTWADKTRGRSRDRKTYVFYAMLQPYPEEGKDR